MAYAAATCWIALGLESIVRPEQENYRDWLWMLPFTLTMLTFYFVHLAQRGARQNVERAGFYFVMIASGLTVLGNVGVSLEQRTLAVLGFPWGAVLWTVGLIGFGDGDVVSRSFAAIRRAHLDFAGTGIDFDRCAARARGSSTCTWRIQRGSGKGTLPGAHWNGTAGSAAGQERSVARGSRSQQRDRRTLPD